eukprot:6010486-Pyramimonas_sp.AAC.1
MHRLHCRFRRRREGGREVRKDAILTRLRCEIAFEQGKQLHLQKSWPQELQSRGPQEGDQAPGNLAEHPDVQTGLEACGGVFRPEAAGASASASPTRRARPS